jgi:hypothetical protein
MSYLLKLIVFLIFAFSLTKAQANRKFFGEYIVQSAEDIQIEGEQFMVVELIAEDIRHDECPECFKMDANSNINRSAALNISTNALAAYSVIYMDPSKDKLRHFSAGYIAGNMTNGFLQLVIPKKNKNRKMYSFLGGIGASVIIGVGKEYWDSLGHGQVEVNDALATLAGGATGSLTISLNDVSAFFKPAPKSFKPLRGEEL